MRDLHNFSKSHTPAELNGTRRIYEQSPFPDAPLDLAPQENIDRLFVHNLATPFYLRDQSVISAAGKAILDAGCGTGFKSCVLAAANPGARVLGIDYSSPAIALARERAQKQGQRNCEFRLFGLEDLPRLGEHFDYINCDEIMYLLPNPLEGLRAVASALKPHGIARVNFHSFWGRQVWYRVQEASRLLGIFQLESCAEQVACLKGLMGSLQQGINLKVTAGWQSGNPSVRNEEILNNELLDGDARSTVAEVFGYFKAAGLEFISMVDWRSWELSDLWSSANELPQYLSESLGRLNEQQQLHLFELLQPVHRLLDFWCSPEPSAHQWEPLSEWPAERWHRAAIYLHPQLRSAPVKKAWERSMAEQVPLNLRSFISMTAAHPVYADAQWLACLYPLFEASQTFEGLVNRWLTLYPIDPVTLAPHSREEAERVVREMVAGLEVFLYLLVEH